VLPACANCSGLLQGEFCSHCGQRARELQRPFLQLVAEVFEHALSLDTKLVRTIRPLLLTPGAVTRSYLAGHRVAYVPPLRAYLVAALIFFGLFSLFPGGQSNVRIVTMGSAEEKAARGQQGTTFSVPERVPFWDDRYQETLTRARQNPPAFARAVYATIPRLFFLFLPMFALFLELFYRKQGYYFEHLVFSLYYHAFVFLSFSALFVIGRSGAWLPAFVSVLLTLGVVGWLVAYLPIALRRVYGGSWPRTLLKVTILGVVYFVGGAVIGAPLMMVGAFLTF
jgi:hypothetical protein